MATAPHHKRDVLSCACLFVLTVILYWPVHDFEFVNYDDPVYVTDNPHVQGGLNPSSIRWAFTSIHASNWHPLTWLSHMLDANLFKSNSGGPHLTNAVIHAVNAVLLCLVLQRMTGRRWMSLFVASLFAFHPLHVESVAWVSERKDVISTFFGFFTLWFYLGHVMTPARKAPGKSYGGYVLALICMTAGLLAKPMLVTLPFVLLLLDYWPLQRFDPRSSHHRPFAKLLLEKTPFLILSLASSAITFFAQAKSGAVASLTFVSWSARLCNAVVSYAVYLGKAVWPVNLAVFYPHPDKYPAMVVLLCVVVLVMITALAIWQRNRRPYLLMGWLWYVGMLVPVIGLVQVGEQAYADRYTYVPLTGFFIAIAWWVGERLQDLPHGRILAVTLFILCPVSCLLATSRQLQYWRNSEILFRRALAVTARNYAAHNNLGISLFKAGKLKEARAHFEASLDILPDYELARLNLGRVLFEQGDPEGAAKQYLAILNFKPDSVESLYNLGTPLSSMGRYDEAIATYKKAIAINPGHTNAHYNLAIILMKVGRIDEAALHNREVLRLDPNSAFANYNLGLNLKSLGRLDEARVHFVESVRLKPDYLPAKTQLGDALLGLQRFENAVEIYQQVLESDPLNAQAHNNIGLAWAQLGRPAVAAEHFTQVLRTETNNINAHYNLANALSQIGNKKEAILHYSEVIRLNPTDAIARAKLDKLRRELQTFDP